MAGFLAVAAFVTVAVLARLSHTEARRGSLAGFGTRGIRLWDEREFGYLDGGDCGVLAAGSFGRPGFTFPS